MVDEKRKQIIDYIAKTYVDPRSHLPYPPLRIEQAMADARISIDPQKSADDQIKDIVDGLRGIIPLKSEKHRSCYHDTGPIRSPILIRF